MKNLYKLVLLVLCFFLHHQDVLAQVPQSFNYQVLARDINGDLLHEQQVGVRIRILNGLSSVYEESFSTATSIYGQVSVQVGSGVPSSGDFEMIDWSEGDYFIEAAIDPEGGSNYTITRTTPLNSVPYALHANTTRGVNSKSSVERDNILNPVTGAVIFCSDCTPGGEFQIFNGIMWINAMGNTASSPILVQSFIIGIKNIDTVNIPPEPNTIQLEILDLLPLDASNTDIIWSSSDETISTVDQNGVMRPTAFGEVTITATAADGSGASASLLFPLFPDRSSAMATGDSLTIIGDTILVREVSRSFIAVVRPWGEVDTLSTWESLNPTLATIDNKGLLTGLADGKVKIVATSVLYPGVTDTLEVEIFSTSDQFMEDIEGPIILIEGYDGENPVIVQKGRNEPLPPATAEDNRDGIVPVVISLDTVFNSPYDNTTHGNDYSVIYTSSDSDGNISKDTISVLVRDTVPPTITMEIPGDSDTWTPIFLTGGDTIFTDNTFAGQQTESVWVTAEDDDGSSISVEEPPTQFNDLFEALEGRGESGRFVSYYTATDAVGNVSNDSIIWIVEDRFPPYIQLADARNNFIVPGSTVTHPQGVPYEPSPSVFERGSTDPIIPELIDDGGLDTLTLGSYTLVYTSIDPSGNTDTARYTVRVRDETPPEILNKQELSILSTSQTSGTRDIGQVIATDNIGIVGYGIEDLMMSSACIPITWPGGLSIDNMGNVFVSFVPNTFEADYTFRVFAFDEEGLKDSTDIIFVYSTGQIKDVRAKAYEQDAWTQLSNIGPGYQDFTYEFKAESNIGDSLLFLTASGTFTTNYDSWELDPVNPGIGSTDFELIQNGDEYILRFVNEPDTAIQKNYNLLFNVLTSNVTDPTLTAKIPINVNIQLRSIREIAPSFDDIVVDRTDGAPLTLRDLLQTADATGTSGNGSGGGILSSVACPLSFADDILGDLAEGLDQVITALPIIPENTARSVAKQLISKLPAYFWLSKDGDITRMNLKIPVKGKKLLIEYVIDPTKGGCYWGAVLGGLSPSSINSRLSALDNNTRAGVVVNTIGVDETSFDCIKLECLIPLEPGAHVVAAGNPIPSTAGGTLASAILSPSLFARVTPFSSGFSDPALTTTFVLKAEFQAEFNKELVERLDIASSAAQATVGVAKAAFNVANDAANLAADELGVDLSALAALDNQVAALTAPISALTSKVADVNSTVLNITGLIAQGLISEEVCTPGVCLIPCFTASWCSCGRFCPGYPCTRGCGCTTRAPTICVPNPVAKALAATIGANSLQGARNTLANATRALDNAQQQLSQVNSLRSAAQFASDQSQVAADAASAVAATAQSGVETAIDNAGPLGDVANYIIDNAGKLANKTVSTSSITFETTIASANSGEFKGTLSFDASILGAPNVNLTLPEFSFNGNQIEAAVEAVVDLILDQIP